MCTAIELKPFSKLVSVLSSSTRRNWPPELPCAVKSLQTCCGTSEKIISQWGYFHLSLFQQTRGGQQDETQFILQSWWFLHPQTWVGVTKTTWHTHINFHDIVSRGGQTRLYLIQGNCRKHRRCEWCWWRHDRSRTPDHRTPVLVRVTKDYVIGCEELLLYYGTDYAFYLGSVCVVYTVWGTKVCSVNS